MYLHNYVTDVCDLFFYHNTIKHNDMTVIKQYD